MIKNAKISSNKSHTHTPKQKVSVMKAESQLNLLGTKANINNSGIKNLIMDLSTR